jgi:hypothetical protein
MRKDQAHSHGDYDVNYVHHYSKLTFHKTKQKCCHRLEETFKASRKRFRIDDGNSENKTDSPKSKSHKGGKSALSPRDPNVPIQPSATKKVQSPTPPPLIETSAPTLQAIEPKDATINESISSDSVFQADIDAAKELVEGMSYKDIRKELKVKHS